MYMFTIGALFLVTSQCAVSTSYNGFAALPPAPVTLHEVDVVTSGVGYRNVTVYYTSQEPVQVHWTVGDGFNLEDLDARVGSFKGNNVSRISVPVDLPYDTISFYVINANRSYEVKVEISYKTDIDQLEIVDQYDLFVPRETEIGISPHGKSRFHVFVNTTNSPYMFGMLQAEMTSLVGDNVNNFASYSFFPDVPANPVRVKKIVHADGEYHAEILLHSPDLYYVGGIISISSACSKMAGIIRRMDIKQTLYLHSRPGSPSVPDQSLAFTGLPYLRDVNIHKDGNYLLRCKAVGSPRPQVSLHNVNSKSDVQVFVPSYVTYLPLQTSATFQFLNVTMETAGSYVCRANNGFKTLNEVVTINIV